MKLCMFHPVGHELERGWVGRIDGDHVIQLAAQTLQSFFTGGGVAREHAAYPLSEVRLLAPILHPPTVRVFDGDGSFAFANASAIVSPGTEVAHPGPLSLLPRLAGIVGADASIAGFTAFAEWRADGARKPKDRDFALGLGPVLLTVDELDPTDLGVVVRVDAADALRTTLGPFDWAAARDLAAEGTVLNPGDVIAGPAAGAVDGLGPGRVIDTELRGFPSLRQSLRAEG
jgi:hypothetical protein